MKNTKRLFAAVMALAVVSAMAPVSAFADDATTLTLTKANPYDVGYILTIPANATITDTGWTALQDLNVKYNGEKSFEPAKKITVTAESANSWKLVSTEADTMIGYTMKSTSTDTKATTEWEFSAEEINKKDSSETVVGTSKSVGIDVSATDYEAAIAATYTDTITFNVAVENAPPTVPATGISLDKTNISLYPIIDGVTTYTITPSATPAETDETLTYSWESSDTSVVKVDNNGKITTVAAGTAIITAKTTAQNGELSATCTVSVNRIATPGRGATNYLTVPGASAENPVYFTGAYTGSATTESIAYSHSTSGSYDVLHFNGSQIYRGDWNVGSALEITGGTGTQSDPYVLSRV